MKKVIILALVFCLGITFVLSGCGSGSGVDSSDASRDVDNNDGGNADDVDNADDTEDSVDKAVDFTFVSPLIAHVVWLGAKDGIEGAAEDFPGLNVVWAGPQDLDAVKQNESIELAIAEKMDGIASFCLSESAMEDVFQKAKDAGIKMYTAGGDGPNIHHALTGGCNADPHNWGYSAGKEISKALEGEKIYAVEFLYALDSELALGIMEGYEAAFAEHDAGYEILTTVASDSDSAVATARAQEIFLTYPEVNAIACCGGEIAGAVAGVMKEMQIDPEKCIVFGDGKQDDCIEAIKEGYVYGSVGQNYFQYGYRPAMWTYMSEVYGVEPVEPFADAGTTLINKDNADTFDEGFEDGRQWFEIDYPDMDWSEVTGK